MVDEENAPAGGLPEPAGMIGAPTLEQFHIDIDEPTRGGGSRATHTLRITARRRSKPRAQQEHHVPGG